MQLKLTFEIALSVFVIDTRRIMHELLMVSNQLLHYGKPGNGRKKQKQHENICSKSFGNCILSCSEPVTALPILNYCFFILLRARSLNKRIVNILPKVVTLFFIYVSMYFFKFKTILLLKDNDLMCYNILHNYVNDQINF